MKLLVNGREEQIDEPLTVADLVARWQLNPTRVAVEVNETLVPRLQYAETPLREGDRVELVTLVGGG